MKRLPVAALVLLSASAVGCGKKMQDVPPTPIETTASPAAGSADRASESDIDLSTLGAFARLPAVMESKGNPVTEEKTTLGRALYYDTRLSAAKDISCNSCHHLATNGADEGKVSAGHKKQVGKRNSPTVYNAAGHFVQFWDGRAKDVEEQATGPMMNPVEMAMPNEKIVIAELARVPWYQEQFKKAFPEDKEPLSIGNVARAIGAFERKLVTPSRWDKYLAGDRTALTGPEKEGFKRFASTGCPTCHAGAYVGGAMFQKLGLMKPWPNDQDLGRYEVTKSEPDKMFFKVPSLRNIDKTGPYFHDGSGATLPEAIKLMARHQLGKELADAEVASIATWLKVLTGELPTDYVAESRVPAEARVKR